MNPAHIENLATADLNQDGLPALVVAVSEDGDYRRCQYLVYINRRLGTPPFFAFDYEGELSAVANTDAFYGRSIALADTDADGDAELFVTHRNPVCSPPSSGSHCRRTGSASSR